MSVIKNERDVILQSAIQRVETQTPKDITLSGRNVLIEVNNITKSQGTNGWDADAFSLQNSTGNAFVSAVAAFNTKEVVFGLNEDPATDTAQNGISYAWHLHSDGTISILENGVVIPFVGGTTTSTGGGQTSVTTTPTVVVLHWYGDSFTYGYDGASGGRVTTPVPAYVDGRTNNLTVVNEGVNSSSAIKALAGTDGLHPSWQLQMQNTTCDWVIIAFMFNDAYDSTTDQFRANLRQMHDIAVATGKKVIFQSCHKVDPSFGDFAPYATAMQAEATALGINYLDVWGYTQTAFTGAIRDWVPDGYHPAQPGYNLIGEYIVNRLLSFMSGIVAAGTSGGVGGGGSTLPPPTSTNTYPQSGTVCYWGDSLVLGLDANFNTGYVTPVTTFDNALTAFTASNEGVTDNTTTRCINGTDLQHAALSTWLQTHPFTYFICNLQLNDHYVDGGITTAQYGTNLAQIVDIVRAAGAIIIFENCNEVSFESNVAPYRSKMAEVATSKSVPLIDQYTYLLNYRLTNNLQVVDMYPNGYHPTQAVYTLKGNYAATRFKEIIGAT